MGERMDKRIRFYIYWILGFVLLGACAPGDKEDVYTEMRAFEDFSHINGDSVAIVPRKVRLKAFQKMEEAKDSLVKYNYLAMTLKTYLITSQLDSAQIVIQQIHDFIERQHSSSQMADLESECFNMKGNIFARVGNMDSAEICFRKAYELRMRGTRIEVVPDILMNLADANNRLGKLDIGAAWYRRALLMCDSLHIASTKKPPIYYGLAQVYVTMRDFEQCDYYYREDYQTAIKYFQKVIDLVEGYADMSFELNLGRLNLGDCYLQLNKVDLAVKYINECQLFF